MLPGQLGVRDGLLGSLEQDVHSPQDPCAEHVYPLPQVTPVTPAQGFDLQEVQTLEQQLVELE